MSAFVSPFGTLTIHVVYVSIFIFLKMVKLLALSVLRSCAQKRVRGNCSKRHNRPEDKRAKWQAETSVEREFRRAKRREKDAERRQRRAFGGANGRDTFDCGYGFRK